MLADCDDNYKFNNFEITKAGMLKLVYNNLELCTAIRTISYNYINEVHNEVIKSSSEEIPDNNASPGFGAEKNKTWPWKSEKGRDTESVIINFGEIILPINKVTINFGDYPKAFEILGYNQYEEPIKFCKEEDYNPKVDPITQEVDAEYSCS